MKPEGVWLPVITPFRNDEIDFDSYRRLIDYYINKGIAGIIPAGTTGECPALSDHELEQLIDKTMEYAGGAVPVFAGVGGNYTSKVVKTVKIIEKYNVNGILSVSPYYNRPDQRGIYEHFKKISESTDLDIIVYNIPYRTGRNIENDTIRRLASLENIVGIKDSCGDIRQSMELLLNPPENFSILTGEDILFYLTLTLGGNGGILAAAHLHTEAFVSVYNLMRRNNHTQALEVWKKLAPLIPLLFVEPNPAPLKYCLGKQGLIASGETRLPIMGISDDLAGKLDSVIEAVSQ
jgi:4-hydroxy-tetrahydrodipicolinate synthase